MSANARPVVANKGDASKKALNIVRWPIGKRACFTLLLSRLSGDMAFLDLPQAELLLACSLSPLHMQAIDTFS